MVQKILTISNKDLTVQIDLHGAMLWSVLENGGETEYLWQGDAKYWTGKAPNLFPYIARMTDKRYRLNGQEYGMNIHGFARDNDFQVAKQTTDALMLQFQDTEETRKQYPYHFMLEIGYQLVGNRIDITYRVENKDEKEMYFGIGGHPGFNVPLEEGIKFEDYYLEFGGECEPKRVSFSPDCFVQGEPVLYPLEKNRILHLHHDLFDDDAIVLTGMDSQVTLKSDLGRKAVRVTYPDMTYVGFWHKPHSDAPYVCVEPWSSLPSRKGIVEDLATQPGLVKLAAGETYTNCWSIELMA